MLNIRRSITTSMMHTIDKYSTAFTSLSETDVSKEKADHNRLLFILLLRSPQGLIFMSTDIIILLSTCFVKKNEQ